MNDLESFPLVRTRVWADGGRVIREHAGRLTPYLAQLIAEDVLRRGPGIRVEIRLGRGIDRAALRDMRERLAPLARKGIAVIWRGMRSPAVDPQPNAA